MVARHVAHQRQHVRATPGNQDGDALHSRLALVDDPLPCDDAAQSDDRLALGLQQRRSAPRPGLPPRQAIMPMPQLKVFSSSGSRHVGGLRPASGTPAAVAQAPRSISQASPSGSTRGGFSVRPPPVIWASAVHAAGADRGQRLFHIKPRRRQQRLAQRAVARRATARPSQGPTAPPPCARSCSRWNAPRSRQGPAARRPAATPCGRSCPALHRADGKARQVEIALVIHARHLGRLAADQRAADCRRSPAAMPLMMRVASSTSSLPVAK